MLMRRVRFGVVLVAVVLALTGFSSKKHGSSSGGGGCSSHRSSTTHHDYDNDDYDSDSGYSSSSSGGGTYTSTPTPTPSAEPVTATLVACVTGARGARKAVTSATVRVTVAEPSRADTYTYKVRMVFHNAAGNVVDRGTGTLDVSYEEPSGTLRLPMDTPSKASQVVRCEVESVERIG
jgi:hypothetical protein